MANTLPAVVGRGEWDLMIEQAGTLVPTGFLPESIRTAQQAAAIMLKGRELGIPPMYALSNIAVIKGKPVAGAELLAALIYRDHGDAALVNTETTSARATYRYKRRGWGQYQTFSFTIEDARQAGITNNPTWTKYPAAMLRARAISAIARMAFPDSIGGLYTPEELGAAVEVDPEGQFTIHAQPVETVADPTPLAAPVAQDEPTEGDYREVDESAATISPERFKEVKTAIATAQVGPDVVRKLWHDCGITATKYSTLTNAEADALVAALPRPATEQPAKADEFADLEF